MDSDDLQKRATQGDVAAQLELGRACQANAKVAESRGWFARAAKSGNIDGLRLLASSLITQAPLDGDRGVNMMRAAADKGDAEAAHICAALAASDRDLPDRWAVARKCLEIAAERGWPLAQEELGFLSNLQGRMQPYRQRRVFDSPRIDVFEDFASREECEWLIDRARPRLARALVYDPQQGGGQEQRARSNSAAAFNIVETDVVFLQLQSRIETIVGECRLESPSVLHYAPGEEFTPHFDFLDDEQPGLALDVARSGQRIATFLVYLNEGFEGGETEFPKLDWHFKGRVGDALLFRNVDGTGKPDPRTFHAGKPPIAGEKWLFSQWLRGSPG